MKFKKDDFNIENFILGYKEDLDYIFRSLKNEKLEDIIDIIDKNSFNIVNKDSLKENNIEEIINSEKYKVFFLLGSVADENETYFRFIDGVQYRIKEGECYEESSEHFNDYKLEEKILNLNKEVINLEDSIGLSLYKENENYIFEISKIDSNLNKEIKLDLKGDFYNLCKKYLNKYKKVF